MKIAKRSPTSLRMSVIRCVLPELEACDAQVDEDLQVARRRLPVVDSEDEPL